MSARPEPVRLHAAGSLEAALIEVTAEFSRREGLAVEQAYGPSGLLRDRIAGGEASHVFASANVQHPAALAAAGKAMAPLVFARNELCALARPSASVDSANLLDRMLDASVKLGISTPGADPSGDYAWAVFARAEMLRPGARVALQARARKLTGGPDSPPPPKDRNVYGDLVSRGEADIFLTYCTNAALARRDFPALTSVALPAGLSVGADHGLTVMREAPVAAWRLAWFVLSPDGQAILRRFGFGAPR